MPSHKKKSFHYFSRLVITVENSPSRWKAVCKCYSYYSHHLTVYDNHVGWLHQLDMVEHGNTKLTLEHIPVDIILAACWLYILYSRIRQWRTVKPQRYYGNTCLLTKQAYSNQRIPTSTYSVVICLEAEGFPLKKCTPSHLYIHMETGKTFYEGRSVFFMKISLTHKQSWHELCSEADIFPRGGTRPSPHTLR